MCWAMMLTSASSSSACSSLWIHAATWGRVKALRLTSALVTCLHTHMMLHVRRWLLLKH